jgi:cyclophilin family peptidyl-prolyl cis-trans isomerase
MRRLTSMIRDLFGHRPVPRGGARRARRLGLEHLEDRCVPANASGVLSGTAFVDFYHTGSFVKGDFLLAGMPVTLTGTSNQGAAVTATATTDSQGTFTFQNIQPGTYQLTGSNATPFGGLVTIGAPSPAPGVNIAASFAATGGQTIRQDVAFAGLAPSQMALNQFLSSTTAADFPALAPGSGVAAASGRANNAPVGPGVVNIIGHANGDTLDLAGFFSDPDTRLANSTITFDTSAGPIAINLFDQQAPQTVANFLAYAQSGAFNNAIFERLESGFVLQGGGFSFNGTFGVGSVAVTAGGSGYTSAPDVTFTSADGKGSGAAGTATISNGAVTSVTITNPGSGYDQAPTVNFTGGVGSGATATASLTLPSIPLIGIPAGLSVESAIVTAGGSGYTSAPDVTFTSADGQGNGATGTATISNGAVTGVRITNPGSGYDQAPTISFSGGGGTGAAATAIATRNVVGTNPPGLQSVESVTITTGGSGYTSAPTVKFNGVDRGAAGTAIISNGVVTGVIITDTGSGYTTAPTISFSGGGGSGAAATANMGNIVEGPGVPNEFTGRHNSQGTLALAKVGAGQPLGGPNSATDEFFFNLNDNSTNLDNQNGGFAVFGQVADMTQVNKLVDQGTVINNQGAFSSIPLNQYQNPPSPVGGVTIPSGGGGSGYTSAPTVTFSAPPAGGTTATGTAIISSNGVVTQVTITNGGSGYTTPPTVTFSAPPAGGTTATGTANLTSPTFPADTNAGNYLLIKDVARVQQAESLSYHVLSATSGNRNLKPQFTQPSLFSPYTTLTYTPGQKGTVTVVVQAADSFGATTTGTFIITVG